MKGGEFYVEETIDQNFEEVEVSKVFRTIDKVASKAIKAVKENSTPLWALKEYSKAQVLFIRQEVCQLPPVELAVLYLVFWENLDLREVAKTLRISFYTVDRVLQTGIKRLRQVYDDKYEQFLVKEVLECA